MRLKDNVNQILNGTRDQKNALRSKFFYLADTPQFMKDCEMKGEFFSVSYSVIVRHSGKDADHNLTAQNWIDLCDTIADPFAIAKHGKGFRVFTNVMVNNKWATVGVDVKNIGKGLEVNAVGTVFGYKGKSNTKVDKEFVYVSPTITLEQRGLLDRLNSLSLSSAQGYVGSISQPTEKSSTQ